MAYSPLSMVNSPWIIKVLKSLFFGHGLSAMTGNPLSKVNSPRMIKGSTIAFLLPWTIGYGQWTFFNHERWTYLYTNHPLCKQRQVTP
jgi:hypothetical protein